MKSTSGKVMAEGPAGQSTGAVPLVRRLFQRQEFGVFLVLILISVFFSISTTTFLTMPNMLNVLRQVSINGIIVMAMTFVIITKDIDPSIGSICIGQHVGSNRLIPTDEHLAYQLHRTDRRRNSWADQRRITVKYRCLLIVT